MAAFASDFMKANDIPGLSIAIAIKGKPAYVEAFGVADRETGEAVTPQHRFRIASISKTITATGIFTLIEGGQAQARQLRVRAGFRSRRRLPLGADLAGPDEGRCRPSLNEQITIEHLLTHTTGAWPHGFKDPLRRNKEMTHRQLIAWTLENMPLTAPPGKTFAYSNFGYVILGRVIEKLTGQAYAQYIQDNILKRCGITGMQMAKNARERGARPTRSDITALTIPTSATSYGWIPAAGGSGRRAI